MSTTDTFTDAQGRRFIAGSEVSEAVWNRFHKVWEQASMWEETYRRCFESMSAMLRQALEGSSDE